MGNVVGCFLHNQEKLALTFSEPLDEGLGHSFCYVRHQSPPHSDRFAYAQAPNGSLSIHDNQIDPQKLQILSETSFKSISGASVSANTSTPRSVVSQKQFNSFANVAYDRAAAFESTSSITFLPLQPIPKGLSQSGPITGSQLDCASLSGPFEKGIMPGPLERGFLSGPLERSSMSGPIEATDRSLFSAPLTGYSHLRRRRRSLTQLWRTFGNPMKKVLSRSLSTTTYALARTQKSFAAPLKLVWGHPKDISRDGTTQYNCPLDFGRSSSDFDSRESHNLQWAQGMAGEDRMHIVLCEEHGWLFVGIYDGFNGPDAPDFLMSNLYGEVYRELRGLLWGRKETSTGKMKQEVQRDGIKMDWNYPKASVCSHGAHEEARTIAGFQKQRDLDSDSIDLDVATSTKEDIRTDNGIDNVDCSQPDRPTRAGSGDFGGELPVHGIGDVLEISPRLSTAGEVETNPELCAVKGVKENVTIGSAKEAEADAGCVDFEGNDVTDRVGEERHNGQQSDSNFRPEKSRKFWLGRSLLKLTLKRAHSKGKEHHKILFPQGLEWKQDQKGGRNNAEDYRQDAEKPCTSGNLDHTAVLEALARALASTERSYLQMAEHSIEETPELALMGSCVLVMLMKGKDLYVMNVGDSRALLAQLKSDLPASPSSSIEPALSQADDLNRTGAGELQIQQELEQIMECPKHLESFKSSHTSSSAGPPAISASLSALQLSSDHSTSVEEEVCRIKAEHPDDKKSISNERVKGRLKVTRAFGAGFLKMPRWNNNLLEMFRVNYVGSAPYVTCTPALHYHMLGPNDRFLVLSSDGLYQYLTNEEVVSHVEWFMERFPDGDPAQYLIEELLFRAARKAGMDFHELLDIPQGDRRRYHDDVSVMVISLEGRIWRSFG